MPGVRNTRRILFGRVLLRWVRDLAISAAISLLITGPLRAGEPADEGATLQPGKMGLIIETFAPPAPTGAGGASAGGVRIKEVTPDGPAHKLGLRVGDIILEANNKPVASHREVGALLRDRLVGVATRLRLIRGTDRKIVDVLVPAAVQPILRIDAGMHNAPIRHLAIDAKGQWIVTASEDKTAKVWELATGRLLASLRPPLGEGDEGRLQAVAMAPDGATVAVAGATGLWEQAATTVYLFDRASGRMTGNLNNLPSRIETLAWSPDGSLLAVSVGGTGGLYVYRTAGWMPLGKDENYAGGVFGLDFDRRNHLITTSHDGYLRMYTVSTDSLKLSARQIAAGGKLPSTARFSPDGAAIAVGFVDSTQVAVFGAARLEQLFVADTKGVRNGDLRSVAWSADGRTLYAAGRYVAKGRQVIRSWSEAGRGQPNDTPVSENSIFDLRELPAGGLVFCTAEPAWGVLLPDGRGDTSHPSPIADFRGGGQQLQVSRDARTVRFSFERNGRASATFDVDDGLLSSEARNGAAVFAPLLEAPGLVISAWKDQSEPKLNGMPLPMRAGENARSLAIAADGARFVIGSDRYLSVFDKTGHLMDRVQAPAAAWAVNLSGDGRYLVAAFADGTIRWYATATGAERLALFAHADKKRWVVWTPSGYYAASAAGEELIGWHVNIGKRQGGDFYPASRFRGKFYRPDVIARILATGTELDAFNLANRESRRTEEHVDISQSLPPVIDPVTTGEVHFSEPNVTVRYKVRNLADSPMTGIRVRVNGNYVPVTIGLPQFQPANADAERHVSVALPHRDSIIELFAENGNGVSTAATFRYLWKGAPTRQPYLPTLHLLAIGISKYRDDAMSLGYPAKDAKDFAQALMVQKGRLYSDIRIETLTDAQATRRAVIDSLAALKTRVRENDVAVLFIAGHGYNNNEGTYHFVPYDFDRKVQDPTGVVYSAIRGTLAEMPGRSILFIDTCHSGNVLGATNLTKVINDLTARENNVIVFASSTQKETSQESDEWRNGAFTKALVEGMRGGGDVFKKGKVMYTGLQAYLSDTVSSLTKGAQHPVVLPGGIEDFVVAIP